MTNKVSIDNNTVIRVLAVALGFFLLLKFVAAITQALTLIAIAVFLALALNSPVSSIASKITKGRRGIATGIAYLIVVGLIAAFIWTIVPPLATQTGEFLDNLPEYIEELSSGDGRVAELIQKYNLDSELNEFGTSLRDRLGSNSDTIFSGINKVGSAIVSLLTVLVLAFLMLVEGPYWLDRFWSLVPAKNRPRYQTIAHKMYNVVTSYINGQLFIALLSSAASLTMMLLMGLPFALSLAGLVGMFGLIPLVGATLAASVVVVVALFKSLYAAIVMAIFFLIYQQIENNVIQPYVQSKNLDVSPLLVFVSVIVGISTGGIMGGFVAIPIAASLKILINEYFSPNKSLKTPKKI